jgi:hypothetical protein
MEKLTDDQLRGNHPFGQWLKSISADLCDLMADNEWLPAGTSLEVYGAYSHEADLSVSVEWDEGGQMRFAIDNGTCNIIARIGHEHVGRLTRKVILGAPEAKPPAEGESKPVLN